MTYLKKPDYTKRITITTGFLPVYRMWKDVAEHANQERIAPGRESDWRKVEEK